MFVSLVEGTTETLGILYRISEDGTRGSVTVYLSNGSTQTLNNVPLEGYQITDGTYIKLSPPDSLTPPAETESRYST